MKEENGTQLALRVADVQNPADLQELGTGFGSKKVHYRSKLTLFVVDSPARVGELERLIQGWIAAKNLEVQEELHSRVVSKLEEERNGWYERWATACTKMNGYPDVLGKKVLAYIRKMNKKTK